MWRTELKLTRRSPGSRRTSCAVAEDSTVFLRRDADPPMEGRSDRRRRAEAREAADVLDRLRGCLQYLARSIDTCVCEPGHRRHPGLFTESTGQRSSSHVRALRE